MQNILGTSGSGQPSRWDGAPMVEVSRHSVPGYSHWSPFLLRPTIHEKTRQRVDYGGQAGTNLCEQNLPFGSQANAYGASPSRLS
jgi:hypothetical protein